LVILVVDNLSPFTQDILDCLDKLGAKSVCRKFSELGSSSNDGITYNGTNNYNCNHRYNKVILSGRQKNNKEINVANSKIIKSCFEKDTPILGICYGAEILALTFGGSINKMNNHIHGVVSVTVSKPSHLMPDRKSVNVYESHRYSVSKLPEGFDTLASSQYCKHEIFSHRKKKIFGTQFHPEKSGTDGLVLLSNFLKI
jgi:GMP synthase (glutamine-hydrolysing)